MVGAVVGANEKDKHLLNVTPDVDFKVNAYHDIRNVVEGDPSPCGKGILKFTRGIEIGHIFKLEKKYSESFNATFTNENGQEEAFIMGCYGIGVTRLIAAIIEQNYDNYGIVWPKDVTPFDIHLITLNQNSENNSEIGEQVYLKMLKLGYSVLYDDRQESTGVKFKDSDLLGIPWKIIVGRKASEGLIEIKNRETGDIKEIPIASIQSVLGNLIK